MISLPLFLVSLLLFLPFLLPSLMLTSATVYRCAPLHIVDRIGHIALLTTTVVMTAGTASTSGDQPRHTMQH